MTAPLTLRRGFALLATLALVLSLSAVPAMAAEPTGSARLLDGVEVLAGTQNATYQIEVSYPEASGLGFLDPKQPVNVVAIVPPPGLLADLQGATDGWDWTRPETGERILFGGAELQPGQTEVFEFTADVARPPEDVAEAFSVHLSDDAGRSFTKATDDGLTTAVRILKITGINVTGPAGVTDGTATTDQANVILDVFVANEGAAAPGGPTSITLDTTLEGAKNPQTRSATSSYGASTTISFQNVEMPSSPGEIQFTAESEAREVDATAIDDVATPLTLMRKLGLAYQGGSLSPQAVVPARVPNAPSYAFETGFDVSGGVTATLDAVETRFHINEADATNSFEASLATPTTVLNDGSGLTLTFQSAQVAMDDGDDYPVTVRVVGTDENDAPIDISPSITDGVDVDGLLPVVLPDLIGDASHLDDPDAGEGEVTTAGRTVDFGGQVNRADSGTACADCSITDAFLQYRFADGTTTDVDVTDAIRLDAGQISGSAEITETAANVVNVSLWVTAARTRSATGKSAGLIVDNVDPIFEQATTGQVPDFYTGAYDKRRVIQVDIAESVKFSPSTSVFDWFVSNTSVTNVEAFKADGTAGHGHADIVILHVNDDLPENQAPQVRYEPGKGTGLDGNRGADQVERELADAILTVVDGIVPDLADLLEVNDRIQQDDTFWSNTTAPSFTLGNVAVDNWVVLYEVFDDGTKVEIGRARQDPNSDTAVINDGGGYTFTGVAHGDQRTVAAEVIDAADNSSGSAEFTVDFDFVAPTLASASQAARDVTITLTEPLTKDPDFVGTNSAQHWAAEQDAGFSSKEFLAQSVSREADSGGQAVLSVTFDEDAATATFDRIHYEFFAGFDDPKRYEDRAGNPLLNFTHEFSG